MSSHKGLRLGFGIGAVAVLAIAAGLLTATQAFAQSPMVQIGRATIATNSEAKLSLEATDIGPPGVGAWSIDISFNPSIVRIVDCETIAGGVCNPEFGDGVVRVVGATAGGLEGNSVLASLTFRCTDPGSTAISIGIDEFADATQAEPQPISVDVDSGSIGCIVPAPQALPGDVNCDGEVNSIDAELVLQFDAGLIHTLPCPQNGDLNNDGLINSVDAALILQIEAGLI